MKRGEIIDRGIAAALTATFMALVRPDPEPSLVGVSIVAILLYEGLTCCIRYIRKERRRRRIQRNAEAMTYDGSRWADEWLYWPMKEVS